MTICDGYTVVAEHGDFRIECRPCLHSERVEILENVKQLSRKHQRSYLSAALNRHIINGPTMHLVGPDDWEWAYKLVIGHGQRAAELEDERNLYSGVRLVMLYPHLSETTCDYCRRFWYDPTTNQTQLEDGKPALRTEEELLCRTPDGCPVGTPENKRVLNRKNRLSFEHYLHCRAVGQWPDDAIVRRNAYVIGKAVRRVQEQHGERVQLFRGRPGQHGGAGVSGPGRRLDRRFVGDEPDWDEYAKRTAGSPGGGS